jgi:hypothetical protein
MATHHVERGGLSKILSAAEGPPPFAVPARRDVHPALDRPEP